eukprot:1152199-Pelagomonas_calceolata.AAC.1
MHLIEIKYCEDTRPGQQLEAAQRQHANLCNLFSAKAVTLCVIFLYCTCNILHERWWTCYTEHTLNQFSLTRAAGTAPSTCINLLTKIHAHSVMYAIKLVTTRRAIDNKNTSCRQVMDPDASNNPPDPH